MKIIKQTVLSIAFLNCVPMSAMEESQKIENVKALQEAIRPLAQKHFDKGNLLFFDGADGANQCHLNAFMVNEYAKNRFDELKPDQQLFLENNMLRSIPLHFDKNDGPQMMEKLFSLSLSNSMKKALKSGKSTVSFGIKKQLIDSKKTFFNENLRDTIGVQWEDVAIDRDSEAILPKFVGIKSVLESLKNESMWMVLKCKTTSMQAQENIQTLLIHPDQQKFITPGSEDGPDNNSLMPVVVVEGNATIRSSFAEHRRRLQELNPEKMQLAIASSWMEEYQGDACSKLPGNLRDEFEESLKCVYEQGLSCNNPETFFIRHMFPDRFKNAVERNWLVSDNRDRKSVLQEGGLETP